MPLHARQNTHVSAVKGKHATFQETRTFEQTYEMAEHLASGGFGSVWQCRERATGAQYACKVMDARDSTGHSLAESRREARLLRSMGNQCRGIVKLHDAMETQSRVYMVMEFCRGGDLFSLLSTQGPLPEDSARMLTRQLCETLKFLHSRGVMHRDIKLENILLDRPGDSLHEVTAGTGSRSRVQTKLADFGLAACLAPGTKIRGYTGSPHYVCPEMVREEQYGVEADVWSLGVVLCCMLTARLPFAAKDRRNREVLNRKILEGEVDFGRGCWNGVSASAKDLVAYALQKDPELRPTAEQLLAHPWLTDSSQNDEDETVVLHGSQSAPCLHTLEEQASAPLVSSRSTSTAIPRNKGSAASGHGACATEGNECLESFDAVAEIWQALWETGQIKVPCA